MTTRRLAWVATCGAILIAACNSVTEQDRANAARRVQLDSQQAAIIGDASDCSKVRVELDAWYEANKNEVDELDQWMREKSEGQEKKLMAAYEAEAKANLKARLMGTIKCGFVPWNGRRSPDSS